MDKGRYTKGLHDLGRGCWAWLQPDGGWGWSNAGLVCDGGESLLVDTLFDLRLTAEMLAAMRASVPAAARIGALVNTHANGDHCYGNQLVADARIIASRASAAEMDELPPEAMVRVIENAAALGPGGEFLARVFSPFEFRGIRHTPPTETFDGELRLRVGGEGGRAVRGRPRAHARRRARLAAAGARALHGRHPVHQGHADRLGGPDRRTGSRPASGSRSSTPR